MTERSENVKGRYTIKPAITIEDSPTGPVTVVKMRPALTERSEEECQLCEGKCLVGHPDDVVEHFRFDTVIARRSSDA